MNPEVTAAIIAASVSFLTLIGTILGRRATRKQLDRTLAEQRTRTLNERFATAAGQLGDDKPPTVRLAGVYAMAGLAEDWPENRQTCVDVLCGYLRMPHEPDPGQDAPWPEWLAFRASREVRRTVIRVITAHLQKDIDAAKSWQGRNFDFTGAIFDGGDFSAAKFSGGTVSFAGAIFDGGLVSFNEAEFSGGTVSFSAARFSDGIVSFNKAEFSGGTVSFEAARFSGGTVHFDLAEFSGGTETFRDARFSDGGTVSFDLTVFSGGTVTFLDAVLSGGMVTFVGSRFSDGKVTFSRTMFSDGGSRFVGARYSGRVTSSSGGFSGSMVTFSGSRFSGGGTVTSSDPRDLPFPPEFVLTDPPGSAGQF
jgi:uncharacterized protein YjbI with pentapeptide repeats